MKCLIIDDEPFALAQLKGYIERIPFLSLTASCQDAFQASEVLSHTTVDLLFADINMPDLNGIEFVRSLPVPPMVIFTTAYSEYAIEGFRLNAIDYLMKPFSFSECLKAAEKARQLYSLTHGSTAENGPKNDALFVKSEYKMVRIDKEKILYIEGMSEYVCIYLEDRPKTRNHPQQSAENPGDAAFQFHACTSLVHCQLTENYRNIPFPDSIRERCLYPDRRKL